MAGNSLIPLRCAGRLPRYSSRDFTILGGGHVQNIVGMGSASAEYSSWRSGNELSRSVAPGDINSSTNAATRIFGRRNVPCRAHTTASEASSGGSNCKNGGAGFIWRTTERRFIDFCLSPEDEKRLLRLHQQIVASPWVSITERDMTECLLPEEQKEEELQQLSLFQKLRCVAK
ncbi:hypothetical protein Emag_002191 [Eimeria magna]